MKALWIGIILISYSLLQMAYAKTIEVDIQGMTCAFCADSLERKFKKFKTVASVKVSLKQKKVRIKMDDYQLSSEIVRKTILDAGFTPLTIRVVDDEK
jgi:copper chaperone CopZ